MEKRNTLTQCMITIALSGCIWPMFGDRSMSEFHSKTFVLKLKTRGEIKKEIKWYGKGICYDSYREYVAGIVDKLSKGIKIKKQTLGATILNYDNDPMFKRYLLEQGVDPNLLAVYFYNNDEYAKYDDINNKNLLNKKIKKFNTRSPLILPYENYLRLERYREKGESTQDYIASTAVLLTYGAQIKLKNPCCKSTYEYWKEKEEDKGKAFITKVCELLIEEREPLTKLDPDFISYIKEIGVDQELIDKIVAKMNGG